MLDQVEHLGDAKSRKAAASKSAAESSAREVSAQESSRGASSSESSDGEHSARESSDAAPLSLMVEGAGRGGSKKKWVIAGVGASVVLACAVAGVPLLTRSSRSESAQAPAVASQPAAPQSDASANPATNEST